MSEHAMNEAQEQQKQEKPKISLEEMLDKQSRGVLKLYRPIRSNEKDVGELKYDLSALTAQDYVKIVDTAARSGSAFMLSAEQALHLFAAAAAPLNEDVDRYDIIGRLSIQDTIKAVQVAQVFFNGCTRMGDGRLTAM